MSGGPLNLRVLVAAGAVVIILAGAAAVAVAAANGAFRQEQPSRGLTVGSGRPDGTARSHAQTSRAAPLKV